MSCKHAMTVKRNQTTNENMLPQKNKWEYASLS